MEHSRENDQKTAFESLIQEYDKILQMYMNKTRKNEGDLPSDRIAHELSGIDKKAKSQLNSDPSSPYGIKAYEKERRRLRAKAFGDANV